MGLGSLFSKAIAKQAVKTADEVVPATSLVQPRRVIAEEAAPKAVPQQKIPEDIPIDTKIEKNITTEKQSKRSKPAKKIESNIEEEKAKAQQFVSEVEDSIQLTKPSASFSQPQKTVKAYKLFRTDSEGNLYPLFIDRSSPVPVGEWLQAKAGELTKEGKVKSSLGPLAYRPGWHAGDLPIATHIGGRYDPKTLKKVKTTKKSKPNVREDNQVWAEVELPADVDWQTVAESRASIVKSGPNKGKINRSEAHITDQLPFGGHYRYKTNPNMTGNWLIGGEMKVNRVLSDDEVRKINNAAGVSDLPRLSDLAKEYKKQIGFAQGGVIPGFQDGGNAVEPTTGNDVPIGSLPNEVADDIPARLSEGEFVLPADVVRFIGLERLMKLRDEAKEGLRRMAEVGQMGNAEDVGEKAEESFEEEGGEEEEDTGKFESDIDEILSEVDSVEGQTEQAFAQGGVVGGAPWLTGFDLKRAPKNPVFDVRYYKHPDGRIMYVTFFNGKPMTPIPDGFTPTDKPTEQLVGKEAEKKKEAKEEQRNVGEGGMGEGAPQGQGITPTGPGDTLQLSDLATGTTVSPTAVKAGALAVSLATGLPLGLAVRGNMAEKIAGFLTNQSGVAAGMTNLEAMGKALGVDINTPAGRNAAMAAIDDLGMTAGLPEGAMTPGTIGPATAMADYAETGAASVGTPSAASPAAPVAETSLVAEQPSFTSYETAAPEGWEGFDYGGYSFKKGGLVSKRQKPMKKPKGKGLAAR